MVYTPEEVGRLLANRPHQPHYVEWLIRMVIAAEREACAKVCDERAKENEGYTEEEHCAQELAAAIRSRGTASTASEPRKD